MWNLVENFIFIENVEPGGIFIKQISLVTDSDKGVERVVENVQEKQTGVVRTNCLDCLDRTNVAQQLICQKAIIEFVINTNRLQSLQSKITDALIYLWAMAGDNISVQYSGTPSVATKIVLKGSQSVMDKVEQNLISLRRWQKQTFTDEFKQECILTM